VNIEPVKPRRKSPDEAPHDGTTRPSEAPLDPGAAESYDDVQPGRFKGDSHSSVDAAVADPDVDDSIGGE
jgi:hypothetical protein